MKRKPSPAVAISLVALFFSLTGAGVAASGYRITSIWQISPKVRHALRAHPAQGLPGAQGPQGIPGAQGPQGPAGSNANLHAVEASSTVVTLCPADEATSPSPCNVGTAIASCPSGTLAIGGGINNASKPPTDISIDVSRAYGLQAGWELDVTNNSTSAVSFFAVANCISS